MVESTGDYPLLVLVAESCGDGALPAVAALACASRSFAPTLRRWLRAQRVASISAAAPIPDVCRLVRLACAYPTLLEIHVMGGAEAATRDDEEDAATELKRSIESSLEDSALGLFELEKGLEALEERRMTVERLQSSGLGRAVQALKRQLRSTVLVSEAYQQAASRCTMRCERLLLQWKALVARPGSRGRVLTPPLRAVAEQHGVLFLPEVLAGVGDEAARFVLTLAAARYAAGACPPGAVAIGAPRAIVAQQPNG